MSKKALCIGINDYPGTQNDLSGCVNDATDWAAELTARGFTAQTLLNAAATKAAMIAAIGGMIDAAVKGDSLIFTYSGHGTWVPDKDGDEPDGRDEALCPYDLSSKGALLDDEIHALFTRRAAGGRERPVSDDWSVVAHGGWWGSPFATGPDYTRWLGLLGVSYGRVP